MYMTPIDVWEKAPGVRDTDNQVAVIPAFGKYPISDRLIYGPAPAVQIWAAQRFERMEAHVQWILKHYPGWGLHSERFVKHALLEPIQKLGFGVVEHKTLCFFRARVDESVWISDCSVSGVTALGKNVREKVEQVLRRKCGKISRRGALSELDCSKQPPPPQP